MPADELNALVLERQEVAPGLIIMRVAPIGWELPSFEAGQFAVLGLPYSAPRIAHADLEIEAENPEKVIKRSYSIASSSKQSEYLEFYVTFVGSGELTPRLFELSPGDRLWLGKKITGRFTLDRVPDGKDVVLMSTGTGLAPYMSMLRTLLLSSENRRFTVVHGARHSWDLGYRSELVAMARLTPNLVYLPSITRPHEELIPWTGVTGYLQELWKTGKVAAAIGEQPTPENTHLFLCGNPSMIEEALAVLAEDGFKEHNRRQPGQVHVEKYW